MAHIPGQLDFRIEEKEFPVTTFCWKISSIWVFVNTPSCIAVITPETSGNAP